MDLRAFWTDVHERKDGRWLAGSDPDAVLTRLGVDLNGARRILEVGPGSGLLTKHLRDMGKHVTVHDIAPIGDAEYAPKLPLKEKADLAIAHLVIQHVPKAEVLVKKVLKSLKPGGRFYFDAVSADHQGVQPEFASGHSFPFTAWDLVDTRTELREGWYACVATAK